MFKKATIVLLLVGAVSVIGSLFLLKYKKGQVSGVSVESENNKIVGIILPHHDLARELIISSLEKFNEPYQLIFIFAPNHFRPIGPEITTATQLSGLAVDDAVISKITQKIPSVLLDNQLIEKEHGISIPSGYLTHYFPGAKIVPIIFSAKTSPEQAEKLASVLADFATERQSLFVASVDFSHEQMDLSGRENNRETIEAISNNDYEKLFTYKDNHIDSPAAAATLLKIMQKLNTNGFEVWHNSHGAILTDNPTLNGTSYVIGVFRSKMF